MLTGTERISSLLPGYHPPGLFDCRVFSHRVTFALLHSFLSKEIELDVTRRTGAERLAMPLARDVVKDLAIEHGACIRPVQLRRTNLDTGTVDQVLVPCGHTLASVCPACAQRA